MKRRARIGHFAAVLAAVAGLVLAVEGRALAIDAETLSLEYNKNPDGFNAKYKGRSLTVTGTIYAFALQATRDRPGTGANLALAGKNYNTYCFLDASGKKKALSLSKGDQITVTGTFVGGGQAEIGLDPCSVR